MLIILLTFGDDHFTIPPLGADIGNLDTIFGIRLWPVLDAIYPLATIAVFLLYGYVKRGRLKINLTTGFLFVSFLSAMTAISVDDVAKVLHLTIYLSYNYWVVVSWIYPVYSGVAFFLFGKANDMP